MNPGCHAGAFVRTGMDDLLFEYFLTENSSVVSLNFDQVGTGREFTYIDNTVVTLRSCFRKHSPGKIKDLGPRPRTTSGNPDLVSCRIWPDIESVFIILNSNGQNLRETCLLIHINLFDPIILSPVKTINM